MAAKEMYDYLSSTVAAYTAADLTVTPDRTIIEECGKNQVVHTGDDGSEEIVTRSNTTVFYMTCEWNNQSASDAGTIYDFFNDTAKGNGIARTFYLTHGIDGHSYTVRFAQPIKRRITQPEFHHVTARFRVAGYKPV